MWKFTNHKSDFTKGQSVLSNYYFGEVYEDILFCVICY